MTQKPTTDETFESQSVTPGTERDNTEMAEDARSIRRTAKTRQKCKCGVLDLADRDTVENAIKFAAQIQCPLADMTEKLTLQIGP